MAAHSAGRLRQGLRAVSADPATFLSGESGTVTGTRLGITRPLADAALNAAAALTLTGPRLDRLARGAPAPLGARGVGVPARLAPARGAGAPGVGPPRRALRARRHGGRGRPRAGHPDRGDRHGGDGQVPEPEPAAGAATTPTGRWPWTTTWRCRRASPTASWPLIEHLGLDLAQPAQTWRSHAAWRVTRRRPALARRTAFVEIGPVTAFSRRAADDAAAVPRPALGLGPGQPLVRRGRASAAGGWAWSTRCRCATSGSRWPRATPTPRRSRRRRRSWPTGPTCTPSQAQRTLATVRRLGR